jgi:CBS domain-containing protein
LGRISGIRIGVNWSVLLIVALLAYGLAAGQFPPDVPHRPEAEYVVAAIVTAVAYMTSLLAHELAHSLVAWGGYLVLARRDYNWIWFIILGWFLTSAATAENQQAVVQSRLRTVAVREIMTADPVTVPASATVTRFLHDLLPWLRHSAFPVAGDDGQTVGLVTVRRVNAVPADERDRNTLQDVACPLAEVARATPDEPVADVLPRLNGCSDGRALAQAVTQPGRLVRRTLLVDRCLPDVGQPRQQLVASHQSRLPRLGRSARNTGSLGGGWHRGPLCSAGLRRGDTRRC